MTIYCGNNQLDPELVNGNSEIGTRFKCLKKGIGVGLNLPYDEKYQGEYLPIDNRRIYCGNQENLPNGYDRFGNTAQCLQKGVALGKRQKALRGPPLTVTTQVFKKKFKYFIFILICLIIFLLMYFLKPNFVINYDKNNNKIIIWEKFILYYLIFCFVILLIIINIDI